MLTMEQAARLVNTPKKIEVKGEILDNIQLTQRVPLQLHYRLLSNEYEDYVFLYDVKQSGKNYFKFSLYLMENDAKIGLIRIDYNGQHQNPEAKTESLPEEFYPYIGKSYSYNEPHVHYYVEEGKSMAWAIPLKDIGFDIQKITSHADINSAFIAFNKLISLETRFNIEPILI
ncbi:hypothetical protein EZS27_001750 [termite gut metagenome]|uniref:Uncharacterized protein n=1 Tax=termite gut metagenome TaxID=433724 RepID=A0A5J4SZU1_9ZZZZ